MSGELVKTLNTVDPVTLRLHSLAEASPELKDAAQLYGGLLPLLREADLRVLPISMTAEQARAKLAGGLPLLHVAI
jgi:hypothetical protein